MATNFSHGIDAFFRQLLGKRKIFTVIVLLVILLFLSLFCELYLAEVPFPVITTLLFVSSTFLLLFIIYYNLEKQLKGIDDNINTSQSQTESLFSLFSLLSLNAPLPPMRRWAMSPDILNIIADTVLERKPDVIVECGGGISSIVTGYLLQKNNKGHLYSLEHEREFAEVISRNVEKHTLSQFITVHHAPLTNVLIKDVHWKWYDTSFLRDDLRIDLLVIDGPPYLIQKQARYPALPLLYKYLNHNAIIIVDDAARKEDKESVQRWLTEFKALQAQYFETEKGTYIIRMRG